MYDLSNLEGQYYPNDSVPRVYEDLTTGKVLDKETAKKYLIDNLPKVSIRTDGSNEDGYIYEITVNHDTESLFNILIDLVFFVTGKKVEWFDDLDNLMECYYLSENIKPKEMKEKIRALKALKNSL